MGSILPSDEGIATRQRSATLYETEPGRWHGPVLLLLLDGEYASRALTFRSNEAVSRAGLADGRPK
jgi:hypothetical protein